MPSDPVEPPDPRRQQREVRRLRDAGLLPTRQRVQLSTLLFSGGDRHFTADQLASEVRAAGLKISLATIYGTLRTFTRHGLLKVVPLATGHVLFDTNTRPHFHLHVEETGELIELPADLSSLAGRLHGYDPDRMEVVAYLRRGDATDD